MNRDEIIETIKELALSQGFYGRLYERLREAYNYDPDIYEATMVTLEAQNFKDSLDLIMYLEG